MIPSIPSNWREFRLVAGHVQRSPISTRLLEAPGTSGINLRHFPSLSHFAKYRCFFNVQASVKFLICISVALLYFIFRKYDEVVSINDIPVSESDQNLVKSLLDGAVTTLNMVRLELLVISFATTPFFLILIYMSIKGDWRRSHQKAWVHYAVNSTSIPDFILAIICLYSLFLFIGSQATGWQLSG